MVKNFGLRNSFFGFLILYIIFLLLFVIWYLIIFYQGVFYEIDEAVKIDGCNIF